MAKLALKRMSAYDLIDLRGEVDAVLSGKVKQERADLERKLSSLARFGAKSNRRGRHAMAGKKVAPKYRGPNGETWSGRGLMPKWLSQAVKDGKKKERFLIGSTASGRSRKRPTKRKP